MTPHPQLPFSGRSPIARHCSYQAAVRASNTRAQKSAQYLAWLRRVDSATDHETAAYFGWPLSSVNSIRNGLVRKELVKAVGSTFGKRRRLTLWAAV